MDIGLILPQGWTGEYDGWEPRAAWQRTVAVATTAERLGFESLWVFDHVQTVPVPTVAAAPEGGGGARRDRDALRGGRA